MYQNTDLLCIFTPEGRVVALADQPGAFNRFEYNMKDHLGNTRVTFTGHADGKPEVNQLTSYDPYGFVTSQTSYYATGASRNKLLYNGKELQDDQLAGTKLDWYDYGARFYDPAIGRWNSVDPLAEKSRRWSPYAYCFDNPIRFIDPDGMGPWDQFVFALQHPIAAMRIGDVTHGSTNISTNAARFSVNTGLPENKSMEGSHVNAFRHSLWQATITSQYGETTAKMAGYAHEDNPAAVTGVSDPSSMTFKGKDALSKADQAVDLLNNQIGQQLGKDNPNASMKDISIKTLDAFKDQGLWTATKQKDGSYSIGQTKLTDGQYNQALDVLQKTNDNGYTPEQQQQRNSEVEQQKVEKYVHQQPTDM